MPESDLSRRSLLVAGGAGLLAAALPGMGAEPLTPPDKQPKLDFPDAQPKKLRWAIVGLGTLAVQQVMPAFAVAQHCKMSSYVSGHPDKAAKLAAFYGVDPKHIYNYENFDAIANDPEIDIVYIILPNHMHAEYTIRALKAAKHVLCEKPMAPTTAECQQMIDAAKQANRKLMIAYRLHYEPYNLKAAELSRNGTLGKLKIIDANLLQNTKAPNIRLSKETAGGPIGDVGIYCLNATRYLTGEEPIEVAAMLNQPSDDPRFAEVPESVTFQLRFPSGVLANCACGFGEASSNYFRVTGTEGWLELDPAFNYSGQRMTLFKSDSRTDMQLNHINQFAQEMDHFSQCVMDNTAPKTPGEEGLRDIVIVNKIRKAAETRTVLRLDGTSA